ncbi:HAD-IIIC family phosphatase [Paenibacillus bouchesdurhonensis]|uniref:HAD-IIIC family phosphatase n=1 Tax=Paenibacillus bouchesdurhonensis TaxID=1870990 RepID=UPI001F2C3B5C|nr:HAD-IIIC family phosphatase [Paenibacillus bouchesdurhonensis]
MIKCIVWDLDDTIWEGILREDADNIILRPGIELVLAELDHRGILHSIASRNRLDQVVSKLEKLGIAQYFVSLQCHFNSKAISLKQIAMELNIGLEALAFVDNDSFERFEMNYYYPQVRTYDAQHYLELPNYPELQVRDVTEESANRRHYMNARQQREAAAKVFQGSREQFLKECQMVLQIQQASPGDYARIVELSRRTNQMNSLLERIDRPFVEAFCQWKQHIIYVARLKDRFGDHGLIGTCFIALKGSTIEIRLFCVSCRIEGRGVAAAFLYTVLRRLVLKWPQVREMHCLLARKERNLPARLLLEMLGFSKLKEQGDKEYINYQLELPLSSRTFDWLEIGE